MRHCEELKRIQRCEALAADGGAWVLRSPVDDKAMHVIASWELGWDHVSVSKRMRAPTWREMEFVRLLFFKPDEWAMQLHVPPTHHINIHPNCLHMWRPQLQDIPKPPEFMV